jgi:hypothetical protein
MLASFAQDANTLQFSNLLNYDTSAYKNGKIALPILSKIANEMVAALQSRRPIGAVA